MSNKQTLQTQAVKKKNEYSKEKDKDLVTNIAHNTNTNSWHLQILNMFTQATTNPYGDENPNHLFAHYPYIWWSPFPLH